VPIYEYTCKGCNSRFEQLVKSMNSDAKVKCPSCGSGRTERELSVFAVKGPASKPAAPAGGHSHGAGCGCCSAARSCPVAQT